MFRISAAVVVAGLAFGVGAPLPTAEPVQASRPHPFHTRSIVACDAQEGACGIAVVSFPTGTPGVVPVWDDDTPGVIVANQAFPSRATAFRIIDNVDQGMRAAEAMRAALDADDSKRDRQFGLAALNPAASGGVDTATFTGARNAPETCAIRGRTHAVQANLQSNGDICETMAAAFEGSTQSLALRLLAALRAGAAVGGDARGEFSASLRVLNYSWPLADFTPLTADANVARSADWLDELTWQAHAHMAMLAPADPRDAIQLTDDQVVEALRALRRLGYYTGPARGGWSDAADAALAAFAANNLFFPIAAVREGGEVSLDEPVARFLIDGETRRVLSPAS